MEANFVGHMSWLQARLPGARVLDGADLLLVDSGFATDTLLTARPLLDAREEGVPLATLQASAQGQPIYQRLGFRPVGRYVEYKPPS
ncbi:MAG TPA: hypothetical protein VGM69_17495 [Chloroflexota bacterium]